MEQKRFECRWRDRSLATLSADTLDVLVVGGGIVGAGIARDAAMRGLRIGLIEQDDFGFGTSSRSARMLHGGLRYLAQGNVGLVRQASLEKIILHGIAPHLALPLSFIFPSYRGTSWPNWKLRIGVKVYDLLCNRQNFGRSSALSIEQVKALLPGICTERLNGGVRYFDGLTNDARLVIDTLRSAERNGAVLLNYARLQEADSDKGLWQCKVRDRLGDSVLHLRSRCVVNATGPWAARLPRSRIKIRGTKGIHVVVKRSRMPIPEAVMMTEQRRVVWAIPWGQRVYIGTTDTDHEGSLETVRTDPEDIRYVLRVVNKFFPHMNLNGTDLVRTWAGVRPLIADSSGAASEVSRSHAIQLSGPGWLDAAGGKLTTYRRMAQEAVDRLEQFLGRPVSPCRTAHEPLLESGEANEISGVIPPEISSEVVRHYCAREWAIHLDDVMIRRTKWHYYCDDPEAVAKKVVLWMSDFFGWTASRQREELERYRMFPD